MIHSNPFSLRNKNPDFKLPFFITSEELSMKAQLPFGIWYNDLVAEFPHLKSHEDSVIDKTKADFTTNVFDV